MRVADVVKRAQRQVETIDVGAPIREAIRMLVSTKARSLVALSGDAPAGLLTMRDVLRRIDRKGAGALEETVADAMSHSPTTVTPDSTLDAAQGVLAKGEISHLPVVDGGKLVGILTLSDVLDATMGEVAGLNEELRRYIAGGYAL